MNNKAERHLQNQQNVFLSLEQPLKLKITLTDSNINV